ncbi:hypothetical protein FRC03_004198 [Tulasnella sp. 419]|nr:hypothetical protein FRC03_004198 [Tulasnella sp. 419]
MSQARDTQAQTQAQAQAQQLPMPLEQLTPQAHYYVLAPATPPPNDNITWAPLLNLGSPMEFQISPQTINSSQSSKNEIQGTLQIPSEIKGDTCGKPVQTRFCINHNDNLWRLLFNL